MRFVSGVAVLGAAACIWASTLTAAADEMASWTGGYVGGHAAWLSGAVQQDFGLPILGDPDDPISNLRSQDHHGGVHAGYNLVHSGAYVFGVEGDYDWTGGAGGGTSADFTATSDPFPGCDGTCSLVNSISQHEQLSTHLDWLSSMRARAGVLVDSNILLFATGGIAFTNAGIGYAVEQTVTLTTQDLTCPGGCPPDVQTRKGGFSEGGSKRLTGYVIGGGVEMKFSPSISGRAEYLYYDFGTETFNLGENAVNASIHENVFRVGLSVYLN
jgi:outer membrane immunogenic protein